MPGRPPEDWGIPIWEAIERWTPKEVWQRYQQIAEEEVPYFIFPPGPTPLHQEASRLRMHIEHVLAEKLRRGELMASGLRLPLDDPEGRRKEISPELWSRLKLDIRNAEASGDGLRMGELRFRTATKAESEQDPAVMDELKLPPNRVAGRPSIMRKIEAEMRRRAASGQIEESLRREAEVLATWAKRAFPDEHIPAPRSIERRLGHVYRELNRIKRPDKGADKI
jgi:hypothetical protein